MKKIQSLIICSLIAVLVSFPLCAKELDVKVSHKDPGVINVESVLSWLTKNGILKANASEAEKKAALSEYMQNKKLGGFQLPPLLARYEARLQRKQRELKANVNLQGLQTKVAVNKTVKVLVVLIDFDDLKHDEHGLTAGDTAMYYSEYPASHYYDMIFSEIGYAGPSSGQTLMSAYQYYQAESGGTLSMEGEVVGWVSATEPAAYYGGNDENDDNDLNVEALVKEAVDKAFALGNITLSDFDHEDPYDLDNDGDVNDPDGFIDHIMIYHSSMGEEDPNAPLGEDAIWSHRYFVDYTGNIRTSGYEIGQTGIKVFGYTIQPIDAAIGVIVHEFGHDLGLADEYNTNDVDAGSPVGYWSLMASGSWAGSPSGTKPASLSPLASDYFQQKFDGNWSKSLNYSVSGLAATPQTVVLNEATDHTAETNLIKVEVPGPQIVFAAPYTGTYQYYSGNGHNENNTMSFSLDLPNTTDLTLQMKAHWNIEEDYDYARVLVDGVAIAGNHTKPDNALYSGIDNYITDASLSLPGAERDIGWVDLVFDMSAYQNSTVTVTIEYVTDYANPAAGFYGIAIDDIELLADSSAVFSDSAEDTPGPVTFNGFIKIESTRPEVLQNYWVQMRSFNGNDEGLEVKGLKRGMLVWFDNPLYEDNHVDEHPGYGFIGVVDAGRDIVMAGLTPASTTMQIRDATFNILDTNDENDFFNDSIDYSTPEQPFSGMKLPHHGLSFTLDSQETDSSQATITFDVTEIPWQSEFSYSRDFRTVTFSNDSIGTGNATATWNFGDGSAESNDWEPTHTYATSDDFTVTLTLTIEADGSTDFISETVTIAEALTASYTAAEDNGVVSFTSSTSGGESAYSYSWNFGDGDTSTEESPTHTYTVSGDYSVTLTVTSADNQTATDAQTVTVYILPVAAYTVATNNLAASFTDTSTGGDGAFTYAWDFGDGGSNTDTSPSHTYASAGTYTVALTVTDGQMNNDTFSSLVTVSSPPPTPPPSSGGGGGSAGFLLLGVLLLRSRLFNE